jgi:HSP20 family molecular chaperone IbpA
MTMLLRTDPFWELERWTRQMVGQQGTWVGPAVMPMDAYRAGEEFIVAFDLPGVDPASVEIDVQRNVPQDRDRCGQRDQAAGRVIPPTPGGGGDG